ncbi:hypothetical protein [Streptomyces cyaneofuscatus]|uniref:hypothetical protein n=1 Tax=Streptomyces cyaneofuscatus TaxID=66883 RepID=UPI00379ED317
MTAAEGLAAEEELIGRCYTKARRRPLVTGTVPGGTGRNIRLVGGPYTFTELATIVTGFVGLLLSRPVWGGHGVTDLVVLVGCPMGAAFALRYVNIDGRNPLAVLLSATVMMAHPAGGHLQGRAYRPGTATRTNALITVAGTDVPVPAIATVAPSRTREPAAPAPIPAAPQAPAGAPVLSGVQALLARRTATAPHHLEN